MNLSEPLAYRVRPKALDDYVGQEHILGKDKILIKLLLCLTIEIQYSFEINKRKLF